MFHFINAFIDDFRGKALPPEFFRDCVTHAKAWNPMYRVCGYVSHKSSYTPKVNHGISNARFPIRAIQHNLKIRMQSTGIQLKSIFFDLVLKAYQTIHWISHSRHVPLPAIVAASTTNR
ncbi:hypothetical protein D3C85_1459690 [compost metagenome]